MVNSQYNVASPQSLPIRIAAWQRRRMFAAFLKEMRIRPEETLLDIGVTADQSYSHSNYLEILYPHKSRITAVGLDDAAFLRTMYPGVTFIRADGRALPFANCSFDIVHSSAVLEHVGSHARQVVFLREAWRVARRGIFLTTPNRWFPIEFHTLVPLLHWLPIQIHRHLLTRIGKDFFAREENLNLLSASRLRQAAREAGIQDPVVGHVSLGGWPSNLLLFASRG